MDRFVVAVDVGTTSARAGIYDAAGRLLGRSERAIALRRGQDLFAVHCSADIWQAVAAAVRAAVSQAGAEPSRIAAIGFDATCSLVVLDGEGRPLGMGPDGDAAQDVIAWFDHRADAEAARLTAAGLPGLAYAGGTMPSEMQLPKLMWIRENRPAEWDRAGLVLDLADYLTWRATGTRRRSLNTLTTKWSYLAHEARFDEDLLGAAGLAGLPAKAGMAGPPGLPGEAAGLLSAEAADALGLPRSCLAAFGLVDAFAGAVAVLAGRYGETGSAALIGGTSSCIIRLAREPSFGKALWGPYLGVTIPGVWVSEGGQSAAGALLDHLIRIRGGGLEPSADTHAAIVARIGELLRAEGAGLGGGIHVLPDFHGNRTPHGDPRARGLVMGLDLDSSFDGLCRLYWRSIVAIALGIRQVAEHMEESRPGKGRLERLHLGGGHARNPTMAQLYADATGRDIEIGAGEEAMLLGTAMVAATAAGWFPDLCAAGEAMARRGTVLKPDPERQARFARDYRVFLALQEHSRAIAAL